MKVAPYSCIIKPNFEKTTIKNAEKSLRRFSEFTRFSEYCLFFLSRDLYGCFSAMYPGVVRE